MRREREEGKGKERERDRERVVKRTKNKNKEETKRDKGERNTAVRVQTRNDDHGMSSKIQGEVIDIQLKPSVFHQFTIIKNEGTKSQ